jgi:hypothetical protein
MNIDPFDMKLAPSTSILERKNPSENDSIEVDAQVIYQFAVKRNELRL